MGIFLTMWRPKSLSSLWTGLRLRTGLSTLGHLFMASKTTSYSCSGSSTFFSVLGVKVRKSWNSTLASRRRGLARRL